MDMGSNRSVTMKWRFRKGDNSMMKYLICVASLVGGIVLRNVLDCFNIDVMSIEGLIICLLVGLAYVLVLNRLVD